MVILTNLSLLLSLILSGTIVILSSEKIILIYPSIIKKIKKPLIIFLLVLSLFIYRYFCKIPKITFYTYVFGNAGVIMSFYLVRFHYIMIEKQSKIDFIIFTTIFVIASIFAISRLFFRSGYIINEKLIAKPEILFILESLQKPSANFFISLGKRLAGSMPQNPGSTGVDRHYALGVGTFCATSIGAASGVYLGYEAYQTRQVNIRTANIAERALDIQERNSSYMSKETFDKKWDEFGNRRLK